MPRRHIEERIKTFSAARIAVAVAASAGVAAPGQLQMYILLPPPLLNSTPSWPR